MRILKIAVGNKKESFIEKRLSDGVNIIASDDNNRGKTIIVQSMMYALGNEPAFPASFNYRDYYYYVEIEEEGKGYKICRSDNGFVVRSANSCWLLENVSEFKRFWNTHISKLPVIVKNNREVIVDPVLFLQLFFIGQDKKDTSNIAHHGYYNKMTSSRCSIAITMVAFLFLFLKRISTQLRREFSLLNVKRRFY